MYWEPQERYAISLLSWNLLVFNQKQCDPADCKKETGKDSVTYRKYLSFFFPSFPITEWRACRGRDLKGVLGYQYDHSKCRRANSELPYNPFLHSICFLGGEKKEKYKTTYINYNGNQVTYRHCKCRKLAIYLFFQHLWKNSDWVISKGGLLIS